ncbi:rhodanese-like domain-containing protein [Lutimaribacter sp. EGI FJ00014]|nr:rhodanese-like domain-containing protein [Lutimaribacter sp. EGI FJ00014]
MFGFLNPSRKVDFDTLMPRIAAGDVTLVDVREAGELAMTGQAKGAIHAPLMRLADLADPSHPDKHPKLNPAKPVALYCASGARSAHGKRLLEKLGYAEVVNLGGLNDWARAGGAVTR